MPEGKFFLLVSKLSGHALGPEGGTDAPGARLVTVPRNDNDDRQAWFSDAVTGTLRNKNSGLCINVEADGNATLQRYEAGRPSQQFLLDGNLVKNRADSRVLDIVGSNPGVGAAICVWQMHGGPNQQFDPAFQKPKYFVLKGEKSGKAIDIEGCSKAAGAKICIYDINKGDNQLWYEDRLGLIRSKLNDFVFDSSGSEITMQPYAPNNAHRAWVLAGSAVAQLSNPTKVLDVCKESNENGARICAYDNRGAPHQKFAALYV